MPETARRPGTERLRSANLSNRGKSTFLAGGNAVKRRTGLLPAVLVFYPAIMKMGQVNRLSALINHRAASPRRAVCRVLLCTFAIIAQQTADRGGLSSHRWLRDAETPAPRKLGVYWNAAWRGKRKWLRIVAGRPRGCEYPIACPR
jgi:hypothetical protein